MMHLPESMFQTNPHQIDRGDALFSRTLSAVGSAATLAAAYAAFKRAYPEEADDEIQGSVDSTSVKDASSILEETKARLKAELKEPELKPDPPKELKPEQTSLLGKIRETWNNLGFWKSEEPEKPTTRALPSTGSVVAKSDLSSSLPSDYRKARQFSGFPLAASISKNGTFTDSEAAMVQALKTSGANTSAFSSMPPEVSSLIRGFAAKHNVDPDIALKTAMMESGGNVNAISSTGAIGIYQFTGKTATSMGITNRFDLAQNIEAGILLLKKNAAILVKGDTLVTPTSLYLAHQLGPSIAMEVIEAATTGKKINQLSKRAQDAIRKNYGGSKAKTAQGYVALTEAKLQSPGVDSTGQTTTAAVSTIPAGSLKNTSVSLADTPNATPVGRDISSNEVAPSMSLPSSQDAKSVGKSVPRESDQMDHKPQRVVKTKNGMLVALQD